MKTKEAIKLVEWLSENTPYVVTLHRAKVFISIIELLQQGEELKEKLTEFLEKENPYSENVFLVIKKEDFVKINNFFKKKLGYPIDRLSGNMGRKIYKTIIEDLRKVIKC